MAAIRRISERHAIVDIVALDSCGSPVLVVSAEATDAGPIMLVAYREILGAIRRDIPFAILADAQQVAVYRKVGTESLDLIATIPTPEILGFYDPGYPRVGVSEDYIVGMIDAWLRDFIRHWKSETPPAWGTMADLGLPARLEHGSLRRRVRLACLPVRRDQLPIELRDEEEFWNSVHPSGSPRRP